MQALEDRPARGQWAAALTAVAALVLVVGTMQVAARGSDGSAAVAATGANGTTEPTTPPPAGGAVDESLFAQGSHEHDDAGPSDDHAATGPHDTHATGTTDTDHDDDHATHDDQDVTDPGHGHETTGTTTPGSHGHAHPTTPGNTTGTTTPGHDHAHPTSPPVTGGTSPTTTPGHDHTHPTTPPTTTGPGTTTGPTTTTPGHDHHGHDVQYADLPAQTRAQVDTIRSVAHRYPTAADATRAGWPRLTLCFAGIAQHNVNLSYLFDRAPLDLNKPEALLYNCKGELVGVNYIIYSASGPPEGLYGDHDVWHVHPNLCLKGGVVIGEQPADECRALGGSVIDFSGFWLLHVWCVPGWESPEGIFSHENSLVV